MKKLLINLVVITAVSAIAFRLTSSFFSDTETSTGNVLAAGAIDLLISNTSYYNGLLSPDTSWPEENLPDNLFFDFNDLKPADWGEDTIGLRVQNDAWACMKINLTENNDDSCTEPELLDDATCSEDNQNAFDGELAGLVNFVFWADDGDNVFETGENIIKEGTAQSLFSGDTWTLADSTANVWTGTPSAILADTPTHIGKYWCFGNLGKTPLNPPGNYQVSPTTSGFTCDGSSLNNAAQTDRLLADVEFTAIQARNNPTYRCIPITPTPTLTPTPTITPTPTPVACVEGFTYASSFEQVNQGTNRDGTAVLASRSNGNFALGVPQTAGLPVDAVVPANSFFSLGFNNTTPGTGGSIVLKFTNPFYDGPGTDLTVFEVTGNTNPPYPDERVNIEVSSDGSTWSSPILVNRDGSVDLSSISVASAQYVRLTDKTDQALYPMPLYNPADGFDVDAVRANCQAPTQ